MKNHYGYDSYRGRSPVRTLLKIIALLLALVLVLSLVGLFLLEPYWVYSADGARLLLPWSQSAPSQPSASAPVSATPFPSEPLVIVTPEPVRTESLRAVLLPQTALSDGSAVELLTAAGGSAALFDMKTDEGDLGFVSVSETAVTAKVNPADPARNAAIQALNAQEDFYSVARVSCFRDNTVPKYQNTNAVRSRSGNWRDNGGYRWLSPSSAEARQYVTGLCLELAGLGFDEILLDNAAYPVDGKLESIVKNDAYDAERLAETVNAFYTELSAALKAAYPDVKLSVVADPAAFLSGDGSPSGQDLRLAGIMDRVWIWGLGDERTACAQLLEENGLEEPETNLVSLSPQPGPEGVSWALWPSE